MRHVLREALSQRVGSKDDGGHLILKLAGADVLLVRRDSGRDQRWRSEGDGRPALPA